MSKLAKEDDSLPESYAYAWSADSSLSLEKFIAKYRPSMVQDDGTKPWIWVKGSDPLKEDGDCDAATEEASALCMFLLTHAQSVRNDPAIPTRSNKKTGARSKKELREEAQAEATEKLKAISIKHGFVSGKWLLFAPPQKVDQIWTILARSLAYGALAGTQAHLAKVATSPQTETPHYQHVMCLYIPDVYDEEAVRDVMYVLLRKHGMNLSGVKSNLYTAIGLDSKHPSGISSTVWKNTSLMKDSDIKELKDTYYAEIPSRKSSGDDETTGAAEEEDKANHATVAPATEKPKPKPKLKKKVANDNPFISDEEEQEEPKPAIGKREQPRRVVKEDGPPKKRTRQGDQ
ncbi:hypothetical protein OE88DRAFT_1630297 [Heliocybe sulcata]|uniref:DUF1917-domain-containing protein n=1 Tax=Heliocybe sulcata TaxID=5364 RepID=A0A5C3N1B5_9AGAM|nr:hypothetical protein OE88DRAFT_1630297 [Heliocybe sulcata]